MKLIHSQPPNQPEHMDSDNCTCRRCDENQDFVDQEYRQQKQEVWDDVERELEVKDLSELITDALEKQSGSIRDNEQTRVGWCREYQDHLRDRHRDVHKNRRIQLARARSEKAKSNVDPKDPFTMTHPK